MKKQFALALAAAWSLSVASVALAAPPNPFVDVSANHWAYDAISALQKDGVIDGYGDGTFRGDRNLTRYEMAAMIAKITYADGKYESLIKRLQSEFATELYNLGVRVDALEKNASTIKFTGFTRLRYQAGMTYIPKKDSDNSNTSRFYQRVHLNMRAQVNDKVEFLGTVRGQNNSNADKGTGSKTSSTGSLFFTRAEFKLTNSNFTASAGRIYTKLGQGLLWDERADGFLLGYNFGRVNMAAGYVDLADVGGYGTSLNAFVTNLGVKVTDKINFTVAYLDAINPQDSVSAGYTLPDGYAFKQWAVGADAKLGKDFKLIGEYVENSDAPNHAQKKGVWGRVQWKQINNKQPGTYSIYADYMKLGNWAIDSTSWGHTLDVQGGNGIDGDGAKGWGLGFQYVPAKNVNMGIAYYDMKPYDKNRSGFDKYKKSYMFTTHFYF